MIQKPAFWLFLVLLAPFLGVYGILQWEKCRIRVAVQARIAAGDIPPAALACFQLAQSESKTALSWIDEHEFRYAGRLYDVVALQTSADSVTYWCYPDDAESRVDQQLADWAARASGQAPNGPERLEHLAQFIKSLYSSPYSPCALPAQPEPVARISPVFSWILFVSLEQTPPAPPPWMFVA